MSSQYIINQKSQRRNVSIPSHYQITHQLTKVQVDWADLVTLDLSQFDVPGGKEKLAKQLDHAVHKVGFL